MTFKKHQIMFNVWFHSWLCIIFQLIPNIPTFSLDLCCVTLLRIFRQIAQIEHFSYAYFRVLFLACDGRRRGDPNAFPPKSGTREEEFCPVITTMTSNEISFGTLVFHQRTFLNIFSIKFSNRT